MNKRQMTNIEDIDINAIYVDDSEIETIRKEFCFADMPYDIARRQAIVWQTNARVWDKNLPRDMVAAARAKGDRFYNEWIQRLAEQEEEVYTPIEGKEIVFEDGVKCLY